MPITYESPQPVSPQISQGYGAAEQFDKFAPTLASVYEASARIAQQATQASAERALRMQEGAANRSLEAGLSHAHAGNQAALQENQERTQVGLAQIAANEHGAAFTGEAQQQANLVNQRAQAQQYLQAQEWSHADYLDMQRKQAAKSAVRVDYDAGNIDDVTAAKAFSQIDAGLNPLRERYAENQLQQQKLQTDQAVRQGETMAALTSADETVRAAAFQKRVVTVQDPLTGEARSGWVKANGDFMPFEDAKAADHAARLELRQKQIDMTAATKGHLTFEQYLKAYHAIEDKVDKRLVAQAAGDNDAKNKTRTELIESALDALKLAPDWEQQAAKQQRELMEMGLVPRAGGGSPSAPVGGNASTGGAPARPFNPASPETMNDTQRAIVSAADAQIDNIKNNDRIPERAKEQAVGAIETGKDILARWGSLSALQAQARAGDKDARRDMKMWVFAKAYVKDTLGSQGEERPRPQKGPQPYQYPLSR